MKELRGTKGHLENLEKKCQGHEEWMGHRDQKDTMGHREMLVHQAGKLRQNFA